MTTSNQPRINADTRRSQIGTRDNPRKSAVNRSFLLVIAFILAFTALSSAQKQAPPAGGPPIAFKVPPRQDFTLPNGLRVTLVPYGDVPKVLINVIVRSGNINEAPNQIWLADLTGDLMKEGTKTRTAEQVAQEAAGMGGVVTVAVGADQTRVNIEVLSEFGPRAAALLGDVAQNPLLPESELARLKNDMQRRLTIELSRPQAVAQQQFRKLLYPNHPYGRVYPTEEMIKGYTVADARNFYTRNFGAQRTHIFIAGKFDTAAMKKAVTDAFGKWARGPEPMINVPQKNPGRAFELLDKPGAPQSVMYIGLPVVDPSSPDYIPFVVMDSLLGGSFGSRIIANIREQKGYAYSPYSQVSSRYRDAYWVEQADVTTAVTGPSLKEIFGEIERLAGEPPSAAELKGTQTYISGLFVLRNSSRQGIINQLNFVDLHGLGDQYLQNYVQRVNAVTPQQISEVTRKYLVPGQMKIVVVGDKAKIADQVKPYMTVASQQ